jgi:hypothetical protein
VFSELESARAAGRLAFVDGSRGNARGSGGGWTKTGEEEELLKRYVSWGKDILTRQQVTFFRGDEFRRIGI